MGRLDPELKRRLHGLFADDAVSFDLAECAAYGFDNSRYQGIPQAVCLVTNAAQVQALVELCSDATLPLVARGRGTGTTGASVCDQGGICISFERMNRILELDPANRIARVEPGVTNRQLQQAAAAQGFFWPPDPTSSAVCTLGGNLACNSAGPRAVKYGTPRENTLGLTLVTGRGQLIRTGTATTKGVVGYDLTRLMIGSEGTLGLITEALLKLTPLPEAKRSLRADYASIQGAASAVAAIMAQSITPCALEFMDAEALALVRETPGLRLSPDARAMLMIEVDGPAAGIDEALSAVRAAAANDQLLGIDQGASDDDLARLWQARAALSPAMRRIAPRKINEDVVVPVSRIPELIEGVADLGSRHGIRTLCFGHAGNGNIHVNLLLDPNDARQDQAADICLRELFELVVALGGSLSGEHGVGLDKRDHVAMELGDEVLMLMRGIKRVFDPAGILNPGKGMPLVS